MSTNTDKAICRPSALTRLDSIRMSEPQRRYANACLRDGELIAALLLRAAADMAAIARGIALAVSSLAMGIKALLAKPVKH